MRDFFTKLIAQLKDIYSKLNKTQKLTALGILSGVVIAIILLSAFSAKPTKVLLYSDLNPKDFGSITKKLKELKYEFTLEANNVWVSKRDRDYIKMKLAQENLIPKGKPGWEIFDIQKWTTTDFERDINKRRAIIGEITRHLKMLDDIEDISIEIAMPQPELYIDAEQPYTASVIIMAAPFSDVLENKNKIKGIINLVARGVDKLKPENIVITDNHGNILSDFSEEGRTDYIERAKREWKVQEMIRKNLLNEIRMGMKEFIGKEKVDMTIRVALNFDQKKIDKKEFIPIKMKEDNPATPYDESDFIEKISRSEKDVDEKFEGTGFQPEGPPGIEPNLPPGYKEATGKFAKYSKKEKIKNYEISEQNTKIQTAPYKVKRISIAVWIDGIWKQVYKNKKLLFNEDGTIKREYIARTKEEMKKFEEIIKGAINYDASRADLVVVKNIPFNWADKWSKEDLIFKRRAQLRKTLVVALGSLFLLFMLTLAYRALMKELARRRRLKEEELAHQQQMIREAALKVAEDEGVEVQLSLEEKARLEMQENAINLARERPEDVANLLRTWMAEE